MKMQGRVLITIFWCGKQQVTTCAALNWEVPSPHPNSSKENKQENTHQNMHPENIP